LTALVIPLAITFAGQVQLAAFVIVEWVYVYF